MTTLLTSESVTTGHPDKVCDQISDAILDAYLAQDSDARVAAEVMASAKGLLIAGEATSSSREVSPVAVARRVIEDIGYTAENGIDPRNISIQNHMVQQSKEIAGGVLDRVKMHGRRALGAGDQGMMFGYATNETAELMPAPLMAARAITDQLVRSREIGDLPWLEPDGKAQVTMSYHDDGTPKEILAVVVSTQHRGDVPFGTVTYGLQEVIVRPALERLGIPLAAGAKLFLNPAGPWTIGGPAADSGLTGRKIIVDTYGGAARHGGGAFSGKDGSKVDRSAAYAARHAAKWLVANGYADRAEIQLSYAIGVVEPVSILIDTFGTGREGMTDEEMARMVEESFNFTPGGIIERFGLDQPIFEQTAKRGHFGHADFPWEQVA